MLTFLRINSLFQLLTLAILLMIFKLPLLGGTLPMLLPELEWMLVGERLNDGHKLYEGIWTNIGPLAASVYRLVDYGFGRDQAAYELTAYFLIIFQAIYITFVTNRRQLFLEKNYVVGAVYLILMNVSFDLAKLSPALMAVTFLMIATNSFLKQVESREGVADDIFEVGLFIGLATMFYLPVAIFLVWVILAALFFTGANFRQLVLIILGFLLPILAVVIYFFFTNDFDLFLFNLLNGSIRINQFSINKLLEFVYTFTFPVIIGILGYLFLAQASRYSGYQSRSHQTALLAIIFALIAYIIAPYKTPMQFVLVIPFLAILVTGLFLHLKGVYLPELLFIIFISIVLIVQYQGVKPLFGNGFRHISELRLSTETPPNEYLNKKMLIIGERIDEYQHAKQVTCYLDWDLAKTDLKNPNNYASVVNIFYNFKNEAPEVIIDKVGVMKEIFERIPELSKDYSESKNKGVYFRK